MEHRDPIRRYNPKLGDFEWRQVPKTDERALELLDDGSPYSPIRIRTYREWRELGASIGAALMRAGEAAKDRSEDEKREGEDAR